MAITYTVKMKDKRLDKEILIKEFEALGFKHKGVEILPRGVSLDYFDELGFYVYLTDAGNYPYNSWETKFQSEDFVFERTLEFRFNKEYKNLKMQYETMLTVIFDVILGLGEESVFISNDDTELCFFKENSEILLLNKSEIWNRNFFKDIITGKNVSYFEN